MSLILTAFHILKAFCLDAVAVVLLGIIYHLLQGNDST